MFYIIVASILTLLIALALIASVVSKRKVAAYVEPERDRYSYGNTAKAPEAVPFSLAGVLAVLLLVVTGIFSVGTVGARSVGIQTGLGKYQGTVDSGWHLVAPYSDIEDFSTRLQPLDFKGDGAIPVTFKGGGSGWLSGSSRWAISQDASESGAKALWDAYRDYDTVRDTLVDREVRDAALNVANDYTPNDARTKQDVIGAEVLKVLATKLGKYGVVVDSVSITSVKLDDRTQQSLDKIVAAQNDVERATAEKQRAVIDNETAELRAKSGALSEGSLTRTCLDIVNAWDVAKNGPLPATFNCGMGSESPVMLGVGK